MFVSRRNALALGALTSVSAAVAGTAAQADELSAYPPLNTFVYSNVPVLGAFTAGKVVLRNNSDQTIPAGAFIEVEFVDVLTGAANTGFNATLTADNIFRLNVSKVEPGRFQISTRKDFQPGERRDLTWSNAWFVLGKRNAVEVRQISSPTVILDGEPLADRYDNFGRGI